MKLQREYSLKCYFRVSTGLWQEWCRESNIAETELLKKMAARGAIGENGECLWIDEEDKLTTIMVTNILNVEKLKTYFNKANIEFDVEDITENFSSEEDEEVLTKFLENLTAEDIMKTFGVEI